MGPLEGPGSVLPKSGPCQISGFLIADPVPIIPGTKEMLISSSPQVQSGPTPGLHSFHEKKTLDLGPAWVGDLGQNFPLPLPLTSETRAQSRKLAQASPRSEIWGHHIRKPALFKGQGFLAPEASSQTLEGRGPIWKDAKFFFFVHFTHPWLLFQKRKLTPGALRELPGAISSLLEQEPPDTALPPNSKSSVPLEPPLEPPLRSWGMHSGLCLSLSLLPSISPSFLSFCRKQRQAFKASSADRFREI